MNPVPKPTKKPQKKAKRNSRPTADDKCEVCGKGYAHLHEVFGGRNRQNSIDWSMQIRLCYKHHNMPGGPNPHFDAEIALELHQRFQRRFEEQYGHKKFVEIFGVNYLNEEEWK